MTLCRIGFIETSTRSTGTTTFDYSGGLRAEPFESINSYSGEVVAELPYLDVEQLGAVVARAHDVFEERRTVPINDRARAADAQTQGRVGRPDHTGNLEAVPRTPNRWWHIRRYKVSH